MGWSAVRRSIAAAVVSAVALAAPAQAASTSFSSSLEAGDPQPTWTNTAERASGVIGPAPGHPGNVTDTVVAVRASGENEDGGEVKENLVDGSDESKWLVFEPTAWVELELADPVKVVRYALTSANDAAGRDPRDWTLKGSNDGTTWTTLDTRSGQDFSGALPDQGVLLRQRRRLPPLPPRHHRQPRRRHHPARRAAAVERRHRPPPAGDMRSIVGAGPRGGYNAKSGVGFTGVRALQYAGRHTSEDRGYSYNKVFDVDVSRHAPRPSCPISIYPDFERDDLSYPSTYAAVDLAFTDGTFLSDLGATGPARRDAEPAGPGRLEDPLHEPVEPQALAHRRRRGRQDDRPRPRRLRQPRRAGRLRRLDRRHRRRARAAGARAHAPLRLGRHEPRHELERRLLARQQHPRDRGAARLQLLDPGHQRGHAQLALRVPEGQQRGQPADAAGVLAQPRAEPVDGRPADLPGDADGGDRDAERRPRGPRAAVPARERDRARRTTTASASRTASAPRSPPPTTRRSCASPSPATRRA